MNTVLDRNTMESVEKERHNAMINERYRQLLNAVENQFSTPTIEKERDYAPTYTAEPTRFEGAATAQQPTVREYAIPTYEAPRPVENVVQAPVYEMPATPKTVEKPQTTAQVSYSLTPLAKLAMAVFTFVVVAMLVLIGLNSHTLQQKNLRIKNLEEQKQELTEKSEQIRRHLEELQTDESIMQRAIEAGIAG